MKKEDLENWPQKGEIEFINVDLKYKEDENAKLTLKNINCKIEAGKKIGIVGRSGSGKSTLGITLSRLYEICGG